jgi:hypothetical protein
MKLAWVHIARCAGGVMVLLAPVTGYSDVMPVPKLLAPTADSIIPFSWTVSTGIEHDDNVTRTVDPRSDNVALAGLNLEVHRDSPRLKLDLSMDGEYRDYLGGTYGNDLVGAALLDAAYTFIPDRVRWIVEDNFGEISDNSFQAQTPDNHRFLNRATTGPDIGIPFNARDRLILQGRFTKETLQDSPDGNHQLLGSAALAHNFTESSAISLNYSNSKVVYDNNSNYLPYDIQEMFVRWVGGGVRTALTTDLGYTELRDNGDVNHGIAARLGLERKIGATSTVNLQAGTQFSNAGDSLQLEQGFTGTGVSNVNVSSVNDPMRIKYAMASWGTGGVRTKANLSAMWSQEHHEISALFDRTREGFSGNLARRMSGRSSLILEGYYTRNKYLNTPLTTNEWQAELRYVYRIRPGFAWTSSISHYQGGGFQGVGGVLGEGGIVGEGGFPAPADTYHENRLFTGLSWSGQK